MSNKLNEFDRLIKETYESQEYPYDATVWDGIEKELGTTAPATIDFFKSITTGVAVAGAVFATIFMLSSDPGSNNGDSVEQIIVTSEGDSTPSQSDPGSEVADTFAKGYVETNLSPNDRNANAGVEETTSDDKPKVTENFTEAQKSTVAVLLAEAKKLANETSNDSGLADGSDEENTASVKTGCTGLSIEFDAPEEYGSDAKYLWNFGDGAFSNEENPTHVFNKEGIFDVSLSVTAVGSGQISSNVVQAMIEVHEAPEARFLLNINSMSEISLKNESVNSVHSQWLIDNREELANDSEIVLSTADKTKFDIVLVVENEGSCTDSSSREIRVIKAGNQFPRVYSSAYASDFAPGAIVDNGEVTDFRVFEKSTGKEVFRSAGSKGWNGKSKNGEAVNKGEYQWMMVVDSEHVFKIYEGALTIR